MGVPTNPMAYTMTLPTTPSLLQIPSPRVIMLTIMPNTSPPKLTYLDFPAARSLFRSLFMEGWQQQYPTWQEAIIDSSQEWSFTADSFREIVVELDALLASYSAEAIAGWLPKICSGLPEGSPDPKLTAAEFVGAVRDLVSTAVADKRIGYKQGDKQQSVHYPEVGPSSEADSTER